MKVQLLAKNHDATFWGVSDFRQVYILAKGCTKKNFSLTNFSVAIFNKWVGTSSQNQACLLRRRLLIINLFEFLIPAYSDAYFDSNKLPQQFSAIKFKNSEKILINGYTNLFLVLLANAAPILWFAHIGNGVHSRSVYPVDTPIVLTTTHTFSWWSFNVRTFVTTSS